jgi:hypothetical protein
LTEGGGPLIPGAAVFACELRPLSLGYTEPPRAPSGR